jgi:hypothetical protein
MISRDRGAHDGTRASAAPAFVLRCVASVAVIALFSSWLRRPYIWYDDFNLLTKSRTWSEALANVWQTLNDHSVPLERIAAAVMMQLVRGQSHLPLIIQIQELLGVIAGMWLLYAFVKRELNHPFYGCIAMTLWGVSSAYYESVTVYSSSYFVLALDALLLALLSAQAWRRAPSTTRRWPHLLLCAAGCAFALAWHSSGIFAGPMCALYLLPPLPAASAEPSPAAPVAGARVTWRTRLWSLWPACVPLLGSAAFLIVSLPRTANQIIHAPHYEGRTIFQATDIRAGLTSTVRALADNLVPGALGVYNKWALPWPAVAVVLAVLIVAAFSWWRVAPRRRLLLMGAVLILASDVLVYSTRAGWSYEFQTHRWTRYGVFPHLGLMFFVMGGLPAFDGRWFKLSSGGALSRRQIAALATLIALSVACHLPRVLRAQESHPDQLAVLKRVELIDAACRMHGIDAATARAALGFLQFPASYRGDNAWDFLRGSPAPRPMSVDEARTLLSF